MARSEGRGVVGGQGDYFILLAKSPLFCVCFPPRRMVSPATREAGRDGTLRPGEKKKKKKKKKKIASSLANVIAELAVSCTSTA